MTLMFAGKTEGMGSDLSEQLSPLWTIMAEMTEIMSMGMAEVVFDRLKLAGHVVEAMRRMLILALKLEVMEYEHMLIEMMEIQTMEMDEAVHEQ